MARTSRSKGPSAGPAAAQALVHSAQQIWLAGLGAFSRARSEGDKMFEVLVEQGRRLRSQARAAADQAYKAARTQADATVGRATGQWDQLEQVFEERVARSLHRLGVVTDKDIAALSRQVTDLDQAVEALLRAGRGAKKAPPRKAASRKPRKATRGSRAPRA